MNGSAEVPLWAAIPVAAFLLVGAGLTLIGSFGLLRLPRFYDRIHAPTLGTSWGTAGIVLASMIYFSVVGGRPVLHELLIGVFVTVTTPVTLMLLGRAAVFRDRTEGRPEVPPRRPVTAEEPRDGGQLTSRLQGVGIAALTGCNRCRNRVVFRSFPVATKPPAKGKVNDLVGRPWPAAAPAGAPYSNGRSSSVSGLQSSSKVTAGGIEATLREGFGNRRPNAPRGRAVAAGPHSREECRGSPIGEVAGLAQLCRDAIDREYALRGKRHVLPTHRPAFHLIARAFWRPIRIARDSQEPFVVIQTACWRGRPACMARYLSADLRIRVIGAVEAGMSRNAAARRFGVSIASAVRWMDEYLRTGRQRRSRAGATGARVGSRRRRSF